MISTICGANCEQCGFKNNCKGCSQTNGNPHGQGCIAAEYIKSGTMHDFEKFKKQLVDEINSLGVDGMPQVEDLFCLCGFYVNMAYPMPSGECNKLLKDGRVYLGCQVPCKFDDGTAQRCFGIVADISFILVCEYGIDGSEPEIVLFKRR